nr:MAG: putative RNA-dependent RNA polymerase [Picobirnavirus sp.]
MSTKKATKSVSKSDKNLDDWVSRNVKEVPDIYSFTEDGCSKLKASLGRTAKGQPEVFTAPFARKGNDDIPMEEVLKEWKSVLVSIADKWPTLFAFEEDLAKKVGPLSVELPIYDRLPDIRHYYEDILLPQAPVDERAIKAVQMEFAGLRGLHQRSLYDTWLKMKKSSSAGSPTMGKRRDYLEDQIASRIYCNDRDWEIVCKYDRKIDGCDDLYDLVAVVGWRGQEGGPEPEDVKQRVIWMFPSALNLHELSVYQPLIEGAQKLDLVPAWVSMESVDSHITKLFDTKDPQDLVVCTDFSKFDQHFNRVMQDTAKAILTSILYHGHSTRNWLTDVFPAKYKIPLCWDYPRKGFISLFTGEHGMASGSGGTNADETLAHRALQYEAAIRKGRRLNPHSMCLGDDGILSYPGITVSDVVEAYQSHGQECNIDKQYASSQDCVYLRRWHHTDYREGGICVGVYSTCRALGKLRYLERYMDPEFWSKEMVAMRQLSIIENCNHHPLFEEFVDFCMKRDKYRLGVDIPGFLEKIDRYAQDAIDYMPEFLGYVKTLQGAEKGISKWRVIQYLKSKA